MEVRFAANAVFEDLLRSRLTRLASIRNGFFDLHVIIQTPIPPTIQFHKEHSLFDFSRITLEGFFSSKQVLALKGF